MRANSPACGVSTAGTSSRGGQEAQAVGVDDNGNAVGQRLAQHPPAAGVGTEARPDDPRLHLPSARDRLGQRR